MSVTDRENTTSAGEEAALPQQESPESNVGQPPTGQSRGIAPMAVFWIGLLLVFLGAMAVYTAWKAGHRQVAGGSEEAPDEAPEGSGEPLLKRFTLTERSGRDVRSEELLGKVWVANFFFSRCPNSCRLQTIKVAGLLREFGKAGVQFVSITVDPKNDTPERLREYARQFEAPEEWLFLTGDMLYLRRVGAEIFRLYVGEGEHVDRLAVVDKWGNVRGRFNWHRDEDMAKMRKLLPELLDEQAEPEEIVDANPPPKPPKPIEYAEPPLEVAPETLPAAST